MDRSRRVPRMAFLGIWIVPECQVRVLSLDYQEYLFRLFHEHRLNRLSHYVGIPMALATLYAAPMSQHSRTKAPTVLARSSSCSTASFADSGCWK